MKRDNIVCAIDRPSECEHLRLLLAENAEKQTDIVVLAVKARADALPALAHTYAPATRATFSHAEKLAEAKGRAVKLLAGQGHPLAVTFEVAQRLRSSRVVLGAQGTRSLKDFCAHITGAWAKLDVPRPTLDIDVLSRQRGAASLSPRSAARRGAARRDKGKLKRTFGREVLGISNANSITIRACALR